jgi:hypothetical protein
MVGAKEHAIDIIISDDLYFPLFPRDGEQRSLVSGTDNEIGKCIFAVPHHPATLSIQESLIAG